LGLAAARTCADGGCPAKTPALPLGGEDQPTATWNPLPEPGGMAALDKITAGAITLCEILPMGLDTWTALRWVIYCRRSIVRFEQPAMAIEKV
jgi:hypothetical protein